MLDVTGEFSTEREKEKMESGECSGSDFGDVEEYIERDKVHWSDLPGEIWGDEVFVRSCSARSPPWTYAEAIKHFGWVEPSPDSLLECDVYSLGMTLLEIVAGKFAFNGVMGNALPEQMEAGMYAKLLGELADRLTEVNTSCWDPDPNNRPNVDSICYISDYFRSIESGLLGQVDLLSGVNHVNLMKLMLYYQEASDRGLVHEHAKKRALWDHIHGSGGSVDWRTPLKIFLDKIYGLEYLHSECSPRIIHRDIKPSSVLLTRSFLTKLVDFGSSKLILPDENKNPTHINTVVKGALRYLDPQSQTSDLGDFAREQELLVSHRHPCIVGLFGLSASFLDYQCMLVMESMNFNLHDLIQSRRGKRNLISATQNTSSPQLADVLPFDLREAVLIIQKIALAMQILHRQFNEVVHRDLKASNILVGQNFDLRHFHVKIADFGMSRCLMSEANFFGHSVGVVGTSVSRAPEILRKMGGDKSSKPKLNLKTDLFSSAADVYSFGMTCFEVITGRVYYSVLDPGDYDAVIGGYRPTLPSDLHPSLKVLIEQCWHCDPNQRPDFSYICEELQRIRQALDSLPVKTADWSKKLPDSTKMSGEDLSSIGVAGVDVCQGACDMLMQGNILEHPCDADLIENGDHVASLVEQHWTDIFIEPVMPAAVLGVDPSALSDDDEPPRKRIQTRNWDGDETRALLEVTEEAPRVNWFYICEKLWEQHGFDRAASSCQRRWDAVLKSFNAIHNRELTNGCDVSDWETDEDERSNHWIPEFDMEWCGMIERILTKSFDMGTSSIQIDASDLSSSVDSELDEVDTDSDDEGLSGDSTAALQELPRDKVSDEKSFSMISRFVNKQIEDAVQPLLSTLQRRVDDLKHREELLVLAEEKLAQKRKKMH